MNKSTCTINKYGDKHWRNSKGECHRTDGPAIECTNGDKEWYFNGKLHRIDGSAIEDTNGRKEYWYRDERIPKDKYYSDEFQVRMVMES